MISFVKTAGLTGILVAAFATVTSDLYYTPLSSIAQCEANLITELGANASAMT